MNKITVMIEKEIDVEELIERLKEFDIVDYDEYEGEPIPQNDLRSEVLAVLENYSKVLYEKDEWYRKAFDLQKSLKISEESLKMYAEGSPAKYMYSKLNGIGIRLLPRKDIMFYIDEAIGEIARLQQGILEIKEQEEDKKPDCYSTFWGALEVCRNCKYNSSCVHAVKECKEEEKSNTPNCFGRYSGRSDDCALCSVQNKCRMQIEGKTNA